MQQLTPEVLDQLRDGRASREEKLAVCTGGVQLPAPDLAEILTVLALDSDELISTRAQESILALPIANFVEALNRQQALEPLDLRRHGDGRNTLEHRPHILGRLGIPAGLLRRRLGQCGVQPEPQLVRQRRQRRQLVDGYVDGPVHPFMVTGCR